MNEFWFKIVLIGDSCTGKEDLIYFLAGIDPDTYRRWYIGTSRPEFLFRRTEMEGRKITLQIWDTTGQESFRRVPTVVPSCYRGTHCVIFLYDITNYSSFESLRDWIQEVYRYCEPEFTHKIIIGTNLEKEDKRVVPFHKAKEFADKLGINLYETYQKKNTPNMDEIVYSLTIDLLK